MDKKNTLIGITLLVLAFVLMFTHQPPRPEEAPERPADPERPVDPERIPADPEREEAARVDEAPGEPRPEARRPAPNARAAARQEYPEDEERVALQNDYMEVVLTNYGGAIREVTFSRFARTKGSEERYVFNRESFAPALSLTGFEGAGQNAAYRLEEHSADRVVYALELENGLEIRRTYTIDLDPEPRRPDDYMIRHETVLTNRGGSSVTAPYFGLNLGTSLPDETEARAVGPQFMNFGFYNGDKANFIGMNRFRGGGFLSMIGIRPSQPRNLIEGDDPIVWASVSNRFFSTIATFDDFGRGYVARPVELPMREGERAPREGVTGSVRFDLPELAPGEERVVGLDYYTGPKEYRRLQHLDERQDLVMQFGFFGFLSKLLLVMMAGIHSFLPNYGLAIICTTVIIKTILWPLTAKAARSSKRMMKIAEPMKELREKFKDNPQKMQQETMKLFRQYQVNPLGGCLPILVQLPIFFALFPMLQSASELRFEGFLWVGDLSTADTVGHVLGFPINIMPVLMGLTMFLQMKMMPTATANPMQQKIFMFMPPVITVMLYQFSAGLTLYWTVNNLLTILQQYLINRQKDEIDLAPVPSIEESSGAKPKRKKPKGKRRK